MNMIRGNVAALAVRILGTLAGAIGAAYALGCADADDTEDSCARVTSVPPPLEPGERGFAYGPDSHFIIGDERIPQDVFDFYLAQTPQAVTETLNFVNIRSPWANQLIVNLTEDNGDDCTDGAAACATHRVIIHAAGEEIVTYNLSRYEQLQTPAERQLAAWWFFNSAHVYYHEIFHALRFGFTWWGVEEGLAEYSAHHLTNGKEPNAVNRELKTLTLESATVPSAENMLPIPVSDVSAYLSEIRLVGKTSSPPGFMLQAEVKMAYVDQYQQYQPGETFTLFVPNNVYTPVLDLHVALSPITALRHQASIATHIPEASFEEVICGNEFLIRTTHMRMDTGAVIVTKNDHSSYGRLTDGNFERPTVGLGGMFYSTAFCFFERMRQDFGASAVNTILLALTEFAWVHEFDPQPFPFFETVRAATGMDFQRAESYFNFFTFPIEDHWYMVGGLCHENETLLQ